MRNCRSIKARDFINDLLTAGDEGDEVVFKVSGTVRHDEEVWGQHGTYTFPVDVEENGSLYDISRKGNVIEVTIEI